MSERPRDVRRNIEGEPLPVRVPGQGADTPVQDVIAERRYADLDGWSQSAQTIMMPAVPADPPPVSPPFPPPVSPPYSSAASSSFEASSGAVDDGILGFAATADPYPAAPRRRLVVAQSEVVPDPPSSTSHANSDLPGTPSARPARPVRRRAALLTGAGLAVALLAGGAFALLGDDDEKPLGTTPVAAAGTVAATTADEYPIKNVGPAAATSPAIGGSGSPAPSRSASVSASASAVARITIGHGLRPITTGPDGGKTGTTDAPKAVLSASYHYDDGGSAGSVRVVNSGTGPAKDWTVTLTVPGGEPVSVNSRAVTVTQAGSAVAFRPAGGAVPAGGSLSFGFSFDGTPSSAPNGCAIDGVGCS